MLFLLHEHSEKVKKLSTHKDPNLHTHSFKPLLMSVPLTGIPLPLLPTYRKMYIHLLKSSSNSTFSIGFSVSDKAIKLLNYHTEYNLNGQVAKQLYIHTTKLVIYNKINLLWSTDVLLI